VARAHHELAQKLFTKPPDVMSLAYMRIFELVEHGGV